MSSRNGDDRCVFIGVPSHDGRIDTGVVTAVLSAVRMCRSVVQFNTCSLLTHNFNTLFCNALNLRRACAARLTHFCLLHSDVVPENKNWLNILIDEMEEKNLDVISSVIPIKDGRGLTSTAMCMGPCKGTLIRHRTRRITVQESMKMPMTFMAHDVAQRLQGWEGNSEILLVNTGLLVIDLRRSASAKLFFSNNDLIEEIAVEGADPGDPLRFVSRCEPEDWFLSRLMYSLGMRYAATRLVDIKHVGRFEFDSRVSWGYELDPVHFPEPVEAKE